MSRLIRWTSLRQRKCLAPVEVQSLNTASREPGNGLSVLRFHNNASFGFTSRLLLQKSNHVLRRIAGENKKLGATICGGA